MMKSYHTQQGSVNLFFHRRGAPSPFLPSADGKPPPIQRLAAGGEIYALPGRGMFAMTWRGQWPSSAAGECRCPPAGAKGGKGTVWFPCPLLTPPNPPLDATPFGRAAKRGMRGLSSVRRFAYGTLLCPEFSLRETPRITVRGHPVQGVCFPLRKAPLRSRVCSWSSKRPCGPLAFRRATEGSRVLRKGWRVKRGRETLVSLPLLPPPPGGGNAQPAHRQLFSPPPAHRCVGGRPAVC